MTEDSTTYPNRPQAPQQSGMDAATPTARQASSIALFVAVVVLLLAVAGGVWWYANSRQAASEIEAAERLQSLGAFVNPMPKEGQDRHVKTVNLSLPDAHENIDAIVPELPKLPYLTSLNARNAPITDDHLAVIGELDTLLDLDLTYVKENSTSPENESETESESEPADQPDSQSREAQSQVTDTGMPHLTGLGNLTKLELYGTQVTEAGLESVAHLETLKILNIGDTNAKGDLSELLPLVNLEWLVAGDMFLADETVDTFAALPKLAKLTIPRTTISDEALAELRERKPGLMIDVSGDR